MSEHQPVLVSEVLEQFEPQPGDNLLDATIGHGGHAKQYLEITAPDGTVVGLDADVTAAEVARRNLAAYQGRVNIIVGNFASLKDLVIGGGMLLRSPEANEPREALRAKWGQPPSFKHVLFDLGIGSHQLADPTRGFSWKSESSLAMRYGQTAAYPEAELESLNHLERRIGFAPDVPQIIAGLTADELTELIRHYGEERYSGRIAQRIKDNQKQLSSSQALAEVIAAAVPGKYRHGRINPATRTFLALRLAVNRELECLRAALPQAVELLKPNGAIAVISFHSLEDRIVKHYFRDNPELLVLTKKPIIASAEEISRNPRSRSAKLRAAVLEAPP